MNICEYIINNNLPHKVLEDGRIEQVGNYAIINEGITCLKNFIQNGYLNLSYNEIESIEYFIQNGTLDLLGNKIKSLKGFVQNGILDVSGNDIESLEGFVTDKTFHFYT